MRKLALLTAFLLIFGLTFGMAEDLTLSGSVELSFGDDDMKVAPGPDFEGEKTGAVATLKVMSEDGNVEAGVTINLLPEITLTDAEDAKPDYGAGEAAFLYDAIQAAVDWYYYQMVEVADEFFDDVGTDMTAVWTDALGGGIAAADVAAGDLIDDDTTVGPWTVGDNPEDIADIDLVKDLYDAVILFVFGQIAAQSAWFTADTDFEVAGDPPYDYINNQGTSDQIAAAHQESDNYDDAYDHVWGEDTDDSWANSFPITNAYLKVMNVFGALDFMAEIEGRAVGVGSMVTSDATAGNDANVGLTVGLSEGVVPGLSLSVLVTTSDDGEAAVDIDYETLEDVDEDAEEPVWGMLIEAGYDAGIVAADVGFGIADLQDTAAYIAGIGVGVSMPDMFGLAVDAELNIVGGDDMGLGAGASLGAGMMGISPTVSVYWKNEFFGDDDTSNAATGADDITADEGLMAEFDSTADASTALAIDVAVDLADLMGMKLIMLSGGYDMMLAPSDNAGWDVGIDLDLAEVMGMPITLGFDVSKWAEEDLLWAAVLGYTYASLGVSFTLEQTEEDVIGWTLAGKVSF
jgi:hypothetical protein